ncbi:hypothetical protein CANCADRAFT_23877 [Tortispora caseinolytica NRRL Y-17796]|uniref:ubiquitinyl hydrolase 1 n=1 Tax=Tortispora caseinolytica NRRL Y-17796 TaxID=767744 RepID=A0A1E4TGP0_9ASCO|nr:hypothetical protein CANCADRAFT_23877 [Tortispora caseinolytica NRRL Y-17796]
MSCEHLTSVLQPPGAFQSIYKDDCVQCFDSCYDEDGINVCLTCFNAFCLTDHPNHQHAALHYDQFNHPIVLNIKKIFIGPHSDSIYAKKPRLEIKAETEQNRYNTMYSPRCIACNVSFDLSEPKLVDVISHVINASSAAKKEEIQAWENELTSCEHVLGMIQDPNGSYSLGDHCTGCELNENLWLCLQCGNLGCGRAQWGGVGGNGHGLLHSDATGHKVAVKLGSITADGKADVYCYACDEERIDPDIKDHLLHWNISIADRVKTEKSLTELQLEQNLSWQFSLESKDGRNMLPVFGKGLTGLANLGNSCYMSSVLQCLFNSEPFQSRFYYENNAMPVSDKPAEDIETQWRKIAYGLLSGRYSKPDETITDTVKFQAGLRPIMFKTLIGKGNEEFGSMRQQDAYEFLTYAFDKISKIDATPVDQFSFILEEKIQCLTCQSVRYSYSKEESLTLPLTVNPDGQNEDGTPKYKPVHLRKLFDNFGDPEQVEFTCSNCTAKEAVKQTFFKTYPQVLAVNANRIQLINWVPTKVDVPLIIDDESLGLASYRALEHSPDDVLMKDEDDETVAHNSTTFEPDVEGLAALESMGFPANRCVRALYENSNNQELALRWILDHMDDPDVDKPLELSGHENNVPNDLVESLESMGFGRDQAMRALKRNSNDLQSAVEWLFSGAADVDSELEAKSEIERVDISMAKDDGAADYTFNSVVCHKGAGIHTGHYVAFARNKVDKNGKPLNWVLFNDEKVVETDEGSEMSKFGYVYFFTRS